MNCMLIRREPMKFNPLEDVVMADEAPSIWDGPHVGKRLSEAMQTLRLLPMPGVCGYRKVRDRLIDALETEGPGVLQLSTQPPQVVVVTKYRMTEEERFGGFCTFDITFVEYGIDLRFDPGQADTQATVANASQNVRDQVQRSLAPPSPSIGTATVEA
ncbi:hypothetical protein ACVIWV_006008 [Bradyrhizobium diazoefficiens]|uniref:Uncharacterized protein n=1 Tax=Bradyrhizobium diazoefficiens TaxID=1355477 RepID=A0A0E4BVK2_9BRAD|nr:hypothetical protein [Bradyrhizobium diazoefficiens]MBR0860907.1 hypothetical protein [Bradyrhizobium diazoefficiens]MBR0885530.1 hypothetical protein [Bradyrhizobium diazoefficiens]MBR0917423.1 hypothetical protein [Bradyrhizobium diazoefficiens]WLA65491.1 hypothetical protein QNN01_00905 [Bradyrhizobium diazoefficiens]BAR61267.1 hypothetical protein NK6_8117 [Bradyrhizobium diazoefficiens]